MKSDVPLLNKGAMCKDSKLIVAQRITVDWHEVEELRILINERLQNELLEKTGVLPSPDTGFE